MDFDRKELVKQCQEIIERIGNEDLNHVLPAFIKQLQALGQKYNLTADEVLKFYMEYKYKYKEN